MVWESPVGANGEWERAEVPKLTGRHMNEAILEQLLHSGYQSAAR